MSCESRRNLEYEREQEEERKRKKKKELEKKRREKALKTIKEQAEKSKWLIREAHPGVFILTRPGSTDRMKLTVFWDGGVELDVRGVISPQNHPSSDAMLANIAEALKGKWKTVQRYFTPATAGLQHTHSHGHGHTHTH